MNDGAIREPFFHHYAVAAETDAAKKAEPPRKAFGRALRQAVDDGTICTKEKIGDETNARRLDIQPHCTGELKL